MADAALRQDGKIDPSWVWKFRILKAEILLRRDAASQAEMLLELPIPPNLPSEVVADEKMVQAQALCTLKRGAEAHRLLEAASVRAGTRSVQKPDLEFILGYCAFAEGDHTLARQHFQNSALSAHGIDAYAEARGLGALGYILMRDGQADEAVARLLAAYSISDSPWLRQAVLGDLGECYAELGDWAMASSYSQQAETLAAAVPDAVQDRAKWLIDLGRVNYSQTEYRQAEKSWLTALAITTDINDPALKTICLANLASLALQQKDYQHAGDYIKQAENLHLQGAEKLYLLLQKAQLELVKNNDSAAEALLYNILSQVPNSQVRYQAETALARVYVAQKKLGRAERMFRDGIATAESAFSQIRSDQFRISFLDFNPFYDDYVNFLVSENRPWDALSIAERARSRVLAVDLGLNPAKDLKLRSVQNELQARKQIALAYWLSPKQSYLWVITPSQMKLLKLAPEMEIVNAIDTYSREVLDISAPQDSKLGQKLYEMLVAPAEKYIPRGARVIIVPHRRLYKLNFETLVSPHPKPHFWIEDVCVQYSSFLAALEKSNTAQPHYSKDLLLMGAPVEASKDFPGLAHAPEEIEKVAAHFPHGKETVIDGAAATPAAYQRSDPSEYRFFHFVTHGTASEANPLDSAIILSPGKNGYKLYARDIIKTRIHPELVTISTCYGAGTRQYSGEGLVGLAWAFLRVGAHHVVAALWEVDDAASADLMDQFYSELRMGKSAAQALRDSKLAMLHSNSHRRRPYYWGSLQLYTGR